MIDLHTHTSYSDGACTAQELIDRALYLNLTQLAITDHFDTQDLNWANKGQTIQGLMQHFENIKAYAKNKPIKVFCGVETSTSEGGVLNLPLAVIKKCDIIITSVHYLEYKTAPEKGDYFNSNYWSLYKEKLLMQAQGKGDVLGHAEAYLPIAPMLEDNTNFQDRLDICARISDRYFDEKFIQLLADALLKSNKAYELHGISKTPREWVVARLHKMGVMFSIGSDAHSADMLGYTTFAHTLAKEYNLRIISPKSSVYD